MKKIDISDRKINLEELTKSIIEFDSDAVITRDADTIVIHKSSKDKESAIIELINSHSPEMSTEEEVEFKLLQEFDQKVRASLVRLGVIKEGK